MGLLVFVFSFYVNIIVTSHNVNLNWMLFFLVIPLAAILTLEAVRSVRGWMAGDES